MTIVKARIPHGKFGYIEIERQIANQAEEQKNIDDLKVLIQENSFYEDDSNINPEVVVEGKVCPKCQGSLVEQIAISPKTNKPFHRVKCINNVMLPEGVKPDANGEIVVKGKKIKYCDHITWIAVSLKP